MSTKVADVLDKAADEVAKGWTRGAMEHRGRCCAAAVLARSR